MLCKVCAKCGIEKPHTDFTKYKASNGKMYCVSRCKNCRNTVQNTLYSTNTDFRLKKNNQSKLWLRSNPDKRNAAVKRHRLANPESHRHNNKLRKYRVKGAIGTYSSVEWLHLKTFYQHSCLCCGFKEPLVELTADHVIPISRGGHGSINNIQPLCRKCNSQKGTKSTDYRGIPC